MVDRMYYVLLKKVILRVIGPDLYENHKWNETSNHLKKIIIHNLQLIFLVSLPQNEKHAILI